MRITDSPTLALVSDSPGQDANYIYFSPNNIIYNCKAGQFHSDYGMTAIDTPLVIGAVGRETGTSVQVLPASGGPAFQNLDNVIADEFFEQVDFKGAFGTYNWLLDWSWLDENGRF